eukprot:12603128-Alexandrium_andersonii.AAC.1
MRGRARSTSTPPTPSRRTAALRKRLRGQRWHRATAAIAVDSAHAVGRQAERIARWQREDAEATANLNK